MDGGGDVALQKDLAAADLAYLEGNEPAGADDAGELGEGAADEGLPRWEVAMPVDPDGGRVDAGEPAAQPVVALVVDDVEEWR